MWWDMRVSVKRKKARKKRQKRALKRAPKFDVHGRYVLDSMAAMDKLIEAFAGADDPVAEIDAAFEAAIADVIDGVVRFDAIRLVEVARLAMLPWARADQVATAVEATAAHVELLALIALSAQAARDESSDADPVEMQEMSHFVSEAGEKLNNLLELSHLRAIATADPTDKLTFIALLLRGSQVLVRNASYADMVEATLLQLLGDQVVSDVLTEGLGFDTSDAIAVLKGVHTVQQAKTNQRGQEFTDAMNAAKMSVPPSGGAPSEETRELARAGFENFFEPDIEHATVSVMELVAETGVSEERVRAVVDRFRLDLGLVTTAEVVENFVVGKNPMRTRPLIATADGERVQLPHSALTMAAVKENLEDYLKTTPVWPVYQKHRGDLLEARTRTAFERALPGAAFRDGFKYYLPANHAEKQAGDPARYTKRVEGDHLVVLDDVAVIIEDKAVALSALSRGGKVARIRTDLSGIVTKAADQAGRLKDAIESDGGVRIEGEGWVDLSGIREIHTVAVSLDDLTSIATATAELVRADLLDGDNIPWTVSLHDLELITQLIDRPAEFLLYLRRRRNPDATVMFFAPDELDLFLHFFEKGLWVEPDPDMVRAAFPFRPPPSTGDRRRFREQHPAFITSRTDDLDRWYYTKDNPGGPLVPKPAMVTSPLAAFIDTLQARGDFGWLSIGATLLDGATAAQAKMSRHANELLNQPHSDGVGRSLTVPITPTSNRTEGWLLVWATRPVGHNPGHTEKNLRDYLRAKKYQLGLPRGVVFLYDEGNRDLVGVYYDGHIGELTEELSARLSSLKPPSALRSRLHPNAKRKPKRTRLLN